MWLYLILFFLLSILFSFLCSIWEAVLLSVTPSYISAKVQAGSPIGQTLEAFKNDIDRPLSAILTLNTIAHTVGAIGVGAQAAVMFKDSGISFGPINMEAIVASIMTLAILILSEIIPKTIGANYWQSLTPFTVRSIKLLILILTPLVWLSQLITKNLKKDKSASIFSRADFRALTQAGAESGALKKAESQTIHNLLKLDQIKVKSIMTPRSVMVSTDVGQSLREFYNNEMPLNYSRIPVFDSEKESIIGILLKDDLFQGLIEKKDEEPIANLMRSVDYISDQASLSQLQATFLSDGAHIAVVTDEFGVVLGIVTWEDLLETILGLEITDETDDVEDLQHLARELWEKRTKHIRAEKN